MERHRFRTSPAVRASVSADGLVLLDVHHGLLLASIPIGARIWQLSVQRSVGATGLLRRHGLQAELVIACRPLPFESHAWVEVNGRVANDRPQYQKFFTVLDRL